MSKRPPPSDGTFPLRETTRTRLSLARPSLAAQPRPSSVPRGSLLAAATLRPEARPSVVAELTHDTMRGLRAWAKQQLGMSFDGDQTHVFQERIQDLCRELQCTPPMLLIKLRNGEAAVVQRAAEKLSTNYTFFRREPEMFEYLVQHVLPTLPSGPLRLWSAAASSGDEAYSLAITCLEFFGPSAAGRVRILGTDISERQVALAERGIYPAEQTALLDRTRAARWFTPLERGQQKVNDLPRQMCTFRRMNLAQQEWPFSQRFHIIFLRNVLYYFDAPTRREVLERCFDAAEEGAVLITSLTEPVLELQTRWKPLRAAVFKREPRR